VMDGCAISEHALEMALGAGLVPQMMLRNADHAFADQPIVRIGPVRSNGVEPLRHVQGSAMPAISAAYRPCHA
jgi:hypothetical protein